MGRLVVHRPVHTLAAPRRAIQRGFSPRLVVLCDCRILGSVPVLDRGSDQPAATDHGSHRHDRRHRPWRAVSRAGTCSVLANRRPHVDVHPRGSWSAGSSSQATIHVPAEPSLIYGSSDVHRVSTTLPAWAAPEVRAPPPADQHAASTRTRRSLCQRQGSHTSSRYFEDSQNPYTAGGPPKTSEGNPKTSPTPSHAPSWRGVYPSSSGS